MSTPIERWDIDKLPKNILLTFENRRSAGQDTLEIVTRAYRVGYAKMGEPAESQEKSSTITYHALDGAMEGPVGFVQHVRGEAAEVVVKKCGVGRVVGDHVLVPREDWDNLWARVNNAERWARLWKRLATKYFISMQFFFGGG